MKNRNRISIVIGGVDYSKYLALPFVFQDTGTEQLDSAIVTLRNLPTDGKFAPFTPVSVCGGKYTYVIADDRVTAVFGRSLWHHEITLIDETKATERILMEGKSFTQPLAQEIGVAKDADVYFETSAGLNKDTYKTDKYQTPIKFVGGATISIISPREALAIIGVGEFVTDFVEVLYSKSEVALLDNQYASIYNKSLGIDETDTFSASASGIYTIKYHFVFPSGGQSSTANGAIVIPVSFYTEADKPPRYSVYDVMQITLETAEPIFKGETPKYSLLLTEEQKARYKAMDAPEMYFANGRSLYENLKEIGDYIHALPKVKNGQVYWQELGSAERADLSKGKMYGANADYNAAEYASAVEANFANLINSSDEAEGSVTDPYTDGYITLRSNSYRIKEEDSYIPTNFPIGTKIKKVLVNLHDINGNIAKTVDITPAVFEKNEYDLLSSFSGIYPFSKTHALYYTTGQKNIEGLWYRAEDSALSFMNQFKRYAITNVINFFGGMDNGDYNYTNLSFQVTYIPIINGRARQERTESTVERIVLAHNQSANQLSAKAFGENLRGKVAMLGNATESKLYIFPSLEDIPKGGQMYDRKKFISLVTTKVFPDYCLSQIDLAENYNALGAFMQMKTGIRQYEIPQGQDRCTLLEEFCVIGKNEHIARERGMLCQLEMCEKTMQAFYYTNIVAEDITTAYISTFDDDGKGIGDTIALPVYSTSLGTSVYFGFSLADNFSAGKKSVLINQTGARGTEFVEYGTPFYSRAKYLSFDFTRKYAAVDATSLDVANSLPVVSGVTDATPSYISTTDSVYGDIKDLIWNKDGADIGNVAYQLHFVSNDGYIIGSELAKMMPYVRTSGEYGKAPKVYFYNTEIDELTGEAHGEPIAESALDAGWSQSFFLRISELPTTPYKSFVIKRPNGACILGKNTENADQVIHFNFKRKR